MRRDPRTLKSLDNFLDEEGIKEEVTATSKQRVDELKIRDIDFNQPGHVVFEQMRLWGEQTFGPGSARSLFDRTLSEVKELDAEVDEGWTPEALEEAADVVCILTRAPGLWEAIERKMKINMASHWNLAGDGTGTHVSPEPIE